MLTAFSSQAELIYFPPNSTSLTQPLDKGMINSFKCCYRRSVTEKILQDIRFEQQTKINIYQAVKMVAASWQEVAAQTVSNCFVKAQINVVEAGICKDEEEPANPADVTESWDALCVNGGVPDEVELGVFLFADNGTVCIEEMSDVMLVEMVQDRGHDEGASEKDLLFDAPTAKEVMDAFDVLRRATSVLQLHFMN